MSIDPKILKRMQGEDTFLQSQNRGQRRVKLNRGQNWIVRFLPAQLGPEGMFFARIAKHWLNKLPITCPRNTAEDYGGHPDADCPVCTMAEELNASADEAISKIGYNAKATPQFLTYCVVWEKDGIGQPMPEILNIYEFWHYRSTWEELKGFYIAGGRKSENSILDYASGNDFSINKTAKGMRLDKQDSSPIFDPKEPKYAEWIKKIEGQMKTPKVTIPTFEQMQVFAAKVEEAAHRGAPAGDDEAPRRRRPAPVDEDADLRRPVRRGAPAPEEDDDLPYDSPSPAARAAAPAPARRSAPEPEDDGEPQPAPRRRPAPEDEAPAPRRAAAPVADEGDEPTPPRRRATPVVDEAEEPVAPPPRRAATARAAAPPVEEEAEEPAPTRRPAPTARRAAPAPVEAEEPEPDSPEPEPEPEAVDAPPPRRAAPAAAGRQLAPTARRAAAPSEAAASTPQAEAEDEDQLPEDDRDTVAPAPKRANPRALEDDDATPPPVARKGGQVTSITDRLSKLPRGA